MFSSHLWNFDRQIYGEQEGDYLRTASAELPEVCKVRKKGRKETRRWCNRTSSECACCCSCHSAHSFGQNGRNGARDESLDTESVSDSGIKDVWTFLLMLLGETGQVLQMLQQMAKLANILVDTQTFRMYQNHRERGRHTEYAKQLLFTSILLDESLCPEFAKEESSEKASNR